MRTLLAALAVVAACQTPDAVETEAPPIEVGMRYAVDPGVVRSLGWVASDAPDAEVLGRARDVLAAELRRRSIDGAFELEGDQTLVVRLPEGAGSGDRAQVHAAALDAGSPLGFFIIAEAEDVQQLGGDLAAEERRLEAWREAHPEAPLASFGLVAPKDGGPHPALRWVEAPSFPTGVAPLRIALEGREFTGSTLSEATVMEDGFGAPALGVEFRAEWATRFEEFTSENVGRKMAIVVEGRVHSAPTIMMPLAGKAVVSGQFTREAVERLAASMEPTGLRGVFRFVR